MLLELVLAHIRVNLNCFELTNMHLETGGALSKSCIQGNILFFFFCFIRVVTLFIDSLGRVGNQRDFLKIPVLHLTHHISSIHINMHATLPKQ